MRVVRMLLSSCLSYYNSVVRFQLDYVSGRCNICLQSVIANVYSTTRTYVINICLLLIVDNNRQRKTPQWKTAEDLGLKCRDERTSLDVCGDVVDWCTGIRTSFIYFYDLVSPGGDGFQMYFWSARHVKTWHTDIQLRMYLEWTHKGRRSNKLSVSIFLVL